MKLGMSYYGCKGIPDAKFESDSSSSFRDTTSQKFPRKKRTESSNWAIYPRKTDLTFNKLVFYVQNLSSQPKIDLHVNFSNFQAEEIFFIL